MTEMSVQGLTALLDIIWLETHPLVADLLYLMRHNTMDRRERAEWSAEYDMLPMHLLHT